MEDKKLEKYKKKVAALESMLENEARALYEEKSKVDEYINFIETMINSMKDMIIAMDEDGKLEFVNEAAILQLNIGPDSSIRDVLGNNLVDELLQGAESGMQQLQATIKNLHGKDLPVLISRVPVEKVRSNKPGYVYSLIDMTSIREQEKIIEKQRAQIVQNSQLASLGEMASGIAHEINNPITVIDGQVRRLMDYMTDEEITLDDKVRLGEKIQKNIKRVVKIVDGIRKISRSDDDQSIKPVKLQDLVSSLKDLCMQTLTNANVAITFPEEVVDAEVLAQETNLLQVLLNLVFNANDAVSHLEDKWIAVHYEESEETAIIRVQDCGYGIAQDILEKIFNPFFTTKDVGKGTGIGLSISKQMVEEFNGELYYEEKDGHTSFVIKLKRPNSPRK